MSQQRGRESVKLSMIFFEPRGKLQPLYDGRHVAGENKPANEYHAEEQYESQRLEQRIFETDRRPKRTKYQGDKYIEKLIEHDRRNRPPLSPAPLTFIPPHSPPQRRH